MLLQELESLKYKLVQDFEQVQDTHAKTLKRIDKIVDYLKQTPITLEELNRAHSKAILLAKRDIEVLLPSVIISTICEKHFEIPFESIVTKCRKTELVVVRQFIAYFLDTYTGLSLFRIGKLFNQKDHCSAHHAREKIKGQLESKAGNACKEHYGKICELLGVEPRYSTEGDVKDIPKHPKYLRKIKIANTDLVVVRERLNGEYSNNKSAYGIVRDL